MTLGCSRFALALALSASPGWPGAQPGGQEPSARPAGPEAPPAVPRPRLEIDVERAITEAVARDPSLAPPRFEERIEVRDVYRDALEEHLRGVDLGCGASRTGAPTALEMNPYRGAAIPPHADFLGAGKAIAKGMRKLLGSKDPRYFLYAVHRLPHGTNAAAPASASTVAGPSLPAGPSGQVGSAPGSSAGDSVSYVVREGAVSEAARSSVPGTGWELIAAFHERDDAVTALDRLQRGFATLRRAREDGRLPPWVSTTCRPPRVE